VSIPDVWVEVNLGALRHNVEAVRKLVGPNVRILAVVKGNGFGHGYAEPARAFVQAGADYLGVTRIDEAIALRQAGITAPILVFAPILADNLSEAVSARLDITVTSHASLRAAAECARSLGTDIPVHIKVDTGMGRLGVEHSAAIDFITDAASSSNIRIAGLYTHLANAGHRSARSALTQLQVFHEVIERARDHRLPTGLIHACNSAGLVRFPRYRFDMVRAGTILYGQHPSARVRKAMKLQNSWVLKSRVCDIKQLRRGTRVGYGGECTLKRDTLSAVIPVGFADGFTLAPEGPLYRMNPLVFAVKRARRKPHVTIRGKRANVLGRVAMQLVVVDVTDIPEVTIGDEVIVPAMRIPVGAQIPRVYTDD